jgi:putative ABC transport system ATP-binding protein
MIAVFGTRATDLSLSYRRRRSCLVDGMAEDGRMPNELVVRGLRRTYDADAAPVRALRGVDLVVGEGEFVALMGPSGSGKSTLLHLLAGLEPADEGSIELAGVRLETLDAAGLARLRRRHVGLVFQFFHLIDHMSALENVALAALVAGAKPAEATSRARDLLDKLGLLDKSGELPAALSGGQRQRVAIARALANRPTLLLADEPTGALDSEGAAEVLALFGRLHRAGQAILMVTHSPEVAAAAERLITMRDGQIVASAGVLPSSWPIDTTGPIPVAEHRA